MTVDVERFGTLLNGPAPAVLTTYRRNGTAVASPVWFRFADDRFDVVIARDDVKLKHLAARPECSLLVFESVPPFRGVRVVGTPTIESNGVTDARRSIATKYLGPEAGARFTARRGPGVILRLPAERARIWDLTGILPT